MSRTSLFFKMIRFDMTVVNTVVVSLVLVPYFIFLALKDYWRHPVGSEDFSIFSLIVFGVGVTGMVIISVWQIINRVHEVTYLIEHGVAVPGKITYLFFNWSGGIIETHFQYAGREITVKHRLWKTRRMESIRVGDEVTIMIDPDQPKEAIIKELYT